MLTRLYVRLMDFTVQGVNDSDKRKYDYADESLG